MDEYTRERIFLDSDSDSDFEVNEDKILTEVDQPTPLVSIPPIDVESDSKKRKRANTSSVWDSFTKLGAGDDGKTRSKCNGCGKVYIGGDGAHGTSTLKRHIDKWIQLIGLLVFY
ncbi:hypothetical protein PIB30_000409 [Stylosanthes scabra]|uniref:BED-type domain-containing protein n=1 Tax=Stylosanthes scabra TaxID=79078 RepID=A0ABU6U1F1_9FABA|nr:hypothetical protein [Stylosanthes scabra]